MSMTEIESRRIVAFQGAPSAVIQTLLADLAAKLAARGLRVAGVIESTRDGASPCKTMELRSLDDGRRFAISQDLGPGSQACNLHPEGLALACAAVQGAIAQGADVVILSKFGKQEAAGGGLVDAFGAAMVAGVPIMTAVSPAMMDEWREFTGDLAECVTADAARLEKWLESWLRVAVTGPPLRDMMRPPQARTASA